MKIIFFSFISCIYINFSTTSLAMELEEKESEESKPSAEQSVSFKSECDQAFNGQPITRELILKRFILCGSYNNEFQTNEEHARLFKEGITTLTLQNNVNESRTIFEKLAFEGFAPAMNYLAIIEQNQKNYSEAVNWATFAFQTYWYKTAQHQQQSIGIMHKLKDVVYEKSQEHRAVEGFLSTHSTHFPAASNVTAASDWLSPYDAELQSPKFNYERSLSAEEKILRAARSYLHIYETQKKNFALRPIFEGIFEKPARFGLRTDLVRKRKAQLYISTNTPGILATRLAPELLKGTITPLDIKTLGVTHLPYLDRIDLNKTSNGLDMAGKLLVNLLYPKMETHLALGQLTKILAERTIKRNQLKEWGVAALLRPFPIDKLSIAEISMMLTLRHSQKDNSDAIALRNIGRLLASGNVDLAFFRLIDGDKHLLSVADDVNLSALREASAYKLASIYFVEAYKRVLDTGLEEMRIEILSYLGKFLYTKQIAPKHLDDLKVAQVLGISSQVKKHPHSFLGLSSLQAAALLLGKSDSRRSQYYLARIVEKHWFLPLYVEKALETFFDKSIIKNQKPAILASQLYAMSRDPSRHYRIGILVETNKIHPREALSLPFLANNIGKIKGKINPFKIAALFYWADGHGKALYRLARLLFEDKITVNDLQEIGEDRLLSVMNFVKTDSLDKMTIVRKLLLLANIHASLNELITLLVHGQINPLDIPGLTIMNTEGTTQFEMRIRDLAMSHPYLLNGLGLLYDEGILGNDMSNDMRGFVCAQLFELSETCEGSINLAMLYVSNKIGADLSRKQRYEMVQSILQRPIAQGHKDAKAILLELENDGESEAEQSVQVDDAPPPAPIAKGPTKKERREHHNHAMELRAEVKKQKQDRKDALKKEHAAERRKAMQHVSQKPKKRINLHLIFSPEAEKDYALLNEDFREKIDNFYEDICEHPFELFGRGRPKKLKAWVKVEDRDGIFTKHALYSRRITKGHRFIYYVDMATFELRVQSVLKHNKVSGQVI